jgi:hypothetical protein
VIELDGGQHYSEAGKARDRTRDDVLSEMGIQVLRYSDRDVFENIGGVMEEIWRFIKSPPASAGALRAGRLTPLLRQAQDGEHAEPFAKEGERRGRLCQRGEEKSQK